VVEFACDATRQVSEPKLCSRGITVVDQLAEACAEAAEALEGLAVPGN